MLRPCSKPSTNLGALRQCEQLRPPQQPQGLSPSDHAPLLWRPPGRVKCDRLVDCTHLSLALNEPGEPPVGTMWVWGCIQGTTWRRQSLCVGNAELSVLVNTGFTNTLTCWREYEYRMGWGPRGFPLPFVGFQPMKEIGRAYVGGGVYECWLG